jgi:hypothetical protein
MLRVGGASPKEINRMDIVQQRPAFVYSPRLDSFSECPSYMAYTMDFMDTCIHATGITNSGMLLTGQLSEEENKHMKRLSEHRKNCSQNNNRFTEQSINVLGRSYFKSK